MGVRSRLQNILNDEFLLLGPPRSGSSYLEEWKLIRALISTWTLSPAFYSLSDTRLVQGLSIQTVPPPLSPNPRRYLALTWRHCSCHSWGMEGAADIWWVETRDAGKHPTVHRALPTAKKYPSHNVNSAEAETPWARWFLQL